MTAAIAGFQVVQSIGNGVCLVIGFGVGEPRRKFLVETVRYSDLHGGAQRALGGNFDQFVGDVPEPRLHPRLTGLPGSAAEPVQAGRHIAGSIARQDLYVLHRHVKLGVSGIDQSQAVMRRILNLERLQTQITPKAMIYVNN